MYGKIPKVSIRGNGLFGRLSVQTFLPKWQKASVAVKSRVRNVLTDDIIEGTRNLLTQGGQGYPKGSKKKPSNNKKVQEILDRYSLGSQKGDGLFFSNMPISAQDGSGSKEKGVKKKLKKLNLSSNEMLGQGFRYE